ncbi:hypothetical protein [Labrenzia sp. PHM005]|uniref:hypothetical protein n=1 Tax=Labrenzia sp. PHM005 TaxID=2590016 RepID=UPI0011401EBD|nr:hypothetical protein [Labrenzia sp. PHM005]QDG77635.1 hypothetical protein FJ695_18160 [Labrenzia sp. PHM005]
MTKTRNDFRVIPGSGPVAEERATESFARQPVRAGVRRQIQTLIVLNAVALIAILLLLPTLAYLLIAPAGQRPTAASMDYERIEAIVGPLEKRIAKMEQRIVLIQADVGLMMANLEQGNINNQSAFRFKQSSQTRPGSANTEGLFVPNLHAPLNNKFVSTSSTSINSAAAQSQSASAKSIFRRIVTPDGQVRYEKR